MAALGFEDGKHTEQVASTTLAHLVLENSQLLAVLQTPYPIPSNAKTLDLPSNFNSHLPVPSLMHPSHALNCYHTLPHPAKSPLNPNELHTKSSPSQEQLEEIFFSPIHHRRSLQRVVMSLG